MPNNLMNTPAGQALVQHRDALRERTLRELLRDPERVTKMTLGAGDVVVDLSRAHADPGTLDLLADLASELGIPDQLSAMVTGQHVNATEDRPALHTALRLSPDEALTADGVNIAEEVRLVYRDIDAFVGAVHDGSWRGSTGNRITAVVNIGIGGSDLGPRMVTRALREYQIPGISVSYVSNVDPRDLDNQLEGLNPAETLFVVVSKTFTTVETLANAAAARRWLTDALGADAVAHHMVAVSAATDRAVDFGIQPSAVFGFWDWVGGRYSLSSPVGLSIELAIGVDQMREFRSGMHEVDQELVSRPLRSNGALMLGLLDVWYTSFCHHTSKAIVPYAQDLELLPAHMQQLQMESNGKSVTMAGDPVEWQTCPTVWGAPGTNGQHAFFQLLHQGTEIVPIDFIGSAHVATDDRTRLLQANLVAQASALALGRTAEELRAAGVEERLIPHRTMPGNRPSSVLLVPEINPRYIGQLIAMYEHSTVVAGLAWGINPFDQWGVELGKQRASALLPALSGGALPEDTDPATRATIERFTQ